MMRRFRLRFGGHLRFPSRLLFLVLGGPKFFPRFFHDDFPFRLLLLFVSRDKTDPFQNLFRM
jgi:hypothetical protein